MNIVDVRKSLTRHKSNTYRKRPLAAITDIAIHHSATTSGSAESYAKHHVNTNGWPGIGYHYVIEQDGTIKHCNDHDTISYHVGNANGYCLGICLTGDFTKQQATEAQQKALGFLVDHLQKLIPSAKSVKGHKELPGATTVCPGNLNFKKIIADNNPNPKPTTNGPIYRVIVDGKQLFALRDKQGIIRQLDEHIGKAKEIKLERV